MWFMIKVWVIGSLIYYVKWFRVKIMGIVYIVVRIFKIFLKLILVLYFRGCIIVMYLLYEMVRRLSFVVGNIRYFVELIN